MTNPFFQDQLRVTRRTLLGNAFRGLGGLALASLIDPSLVRGAPAAGGSKLDKWLGVVTPPHVAPKAKRVIHLCMAGVPPHLDAFDYKPKLAEMHGQEMPGSFTARMPIAQLQGQQLKCYGPQWEFNKFGKSGQEMNALFTKLGAVAD